MVAASFSKMFVSYHITTVPQPRRPWLEPSLLWKSESCINTYTFSKGHEYFYNHTVKDVMTFICAYKWYNNLEPYLVGHHKTLVTGLLWVRVRTGFSKFLVSHTDIWFSTKDASWWSFCGSTTSPYTAFVGVELTALLESEIQITEFSMFLNILLKYNYN